MPDFTSEHVLLVTSASNLRSRFSNDGGLFCAPLRTRLRGRNIFRFKPYYPFDPNRAAQLSACGLVLRMAFAKPQGSSEEDLTDQISPRYAHEVY